MIICYIALGSNLEDPIHQLKTAIIHLKKIPHTTFDKMSSLYHSKPLDALPHPNYLNAVCRVKTKLTAHELLEELKNIELKQGRIRRHAQTEPRTLDLDLILYGKTCMTTSELIIPHPRMKERDFVLLPLAELDPNLQLPDGTGIQTCIAELNESNVIMVDSKIIRT